MLIENFIEASNRAASVGELFGCFQASMRRLGFDRLIFSLGTDHVRIRHAARHGVLSSYPADWLRFYIQVGYEKIDPVRQAYGVDRPFTWRGIRAQPNLSKPQIGVLDEGEEAGLHDGIGIPLRGTHGALAGVGAASSTKGVDLNARTICEANLLSQQFYLAYLDLCSEGAPPQPAVLSAQEREILAWCANGKTKPEIAQILNISVHAVDYHCRRAFKKLQVSNLTSALLKAIRWNMVRV